MEVLVTGAAGFIGYHTTVELLGRGHRVIGIDNINDYYDPAIKRARLKLLDQLGGDFTFERLDLADRDEMARLFRQHNFDLVIHLGAQAGVRYSLQNPHAYADSNLVGTLNILEGCRHSSNLQQLIYASSSSVYGMNSKMPFSTSDNVDHPVSLYAATKKSNELMAHAYAHLYQIPTTGLRFFTVYGPWGRPDMAYWTFTEKILRGEPLPVFNQGKLQRDFTYIDDIVDGLVRCIDHIPTPMIAGTPLSPAVSSAPYRLFNIGNNQPVAIEHFIRCLETSLGRTAERQYLPMQPGDVEATWADIDDLQTLTGYKPATPIDVGIKKFCDWYRDYML